MKKETLEEVAKRFTTFCTWGCEKSFIEGAKWQQERSYSEEDMNQYSDYVLMCSAEKTFKLPLPPKEWFKQLKNK